MEQRSRANELNAVRHRERKQKQTTVRGTQAFFDRLGVMIRFDDPKCSFRWNTYVTVLDDIFGDDRQSFFGSLGVTSLIIDSIFFS